MGQPIGAAARDDRERPEPSAPRPPRARARGDRPGPELLPRVPIARAAGWMLPQQPPPESAEERVQQGLEGYFREELHQDLLSKVGAHPWYQGIARRLRRRFRPDMARLQRERRAPMTVLQQVMDELGRYGPPETPVPSRAIRPMEVLEGSLSREDVAALRTAEAQSALVAPTTWYRVDVRVTHSAEGVVSAAWVERSSGYRTVDEAALRAVRRGLGGLPSPPPEVIGQRDGIQSDWSLEVGDVATPWNQAGCVDDPIDGGLQCHVRGRGITRVRVRLLRVVDATRRSIDRRPIERGRVRPATSRRANPGL